MGKPQEARTILATLEAPFLHREYFRSFARCGVLRNTGRALVAHIGSGYARRSFDVKAAKESLTPSPASSAPASLASIFFLFYCVGFDSTLCVFSYEDRRLSSALPPTYRKYPSSPFVQASRSIICKADDPAQDYS